MAVDINNDIIDLKTLVKVIKENKKKFIILQIAVVALVSLFIATTPKEYRANAEIAPEISTDQNNNVVNMLRLISQINFTPKEIDAIYPLMYPNVVNSDYFTTKLFNTKISTIDGKINTTYYDYLKNHTKTPLWKKPFVFVSNIFKQKNDTISHTANLGTETSVVKLTREQEEIA
ncbi:MAG: Wzz/FepE/Etk N-terminal domain-containing protein, partial [Bacteroidaceae bacterium]